MGCLSCIKAAVTENTCINLIIIAHSVAMIKHGMTVLTASVEHLNPGQISVIAMDPPLYALAKQVQWYWPETMGEESMLIMLGGLHIEMAAFRSLGIWLADSGWTNILVTSEVTTPGTADSFLM